MSRYFIFPALSVRRDEFCSLFRFFPENCDFEYISRTFRNIFVRS